MDRTKDRLYFFITQRYRSQENRELGDYVFANHLFHAFDDDFADFLFHDRDEIGEYLSSPDHAGELIEYCIRSTKEYTYSRNQFINFTEQYDELLYAEYADLLIQIRKLVNESVAKEALSQLFASILQRHHERLRLILSSYCVITTKNDLENNPLLQSVPCEEYSARFQLQILNLELEDIVEPVLDIGCGAEGMLVKFLKAQGFDAHGLDRLAPKAEAFTQRNWFDFEYGREKWGTVIAHQSFSTHFIYNYLSNPSQADSYTSLAMKILTSLQADGMFCYAPGLPFLEDGLVHSGNFDVTRKIIAADLSGLGEIAYAAHIKLI